MDEAGYRLGQDLRYVLPRTGTPEFDILEPDGLLLERFALRAAVDKDEMNSLAHPPEVERGGERMGHADRSDVANRELFRPGRRFGDDRSVTATIWSAER